MDLTLNDSEAAFRDEVRTWLEANHPGEEPAGDIEAFKFRRAWQKQMHEAGWAGISWPKEFGGRGATLIEQAIFAGEMARADAPSPANILGLVMGGPVIMAHGTDEQKERWLEPILSGEEIWCQGFSEPDHGSDLGNAQTRAVRDGDEYVLNGQKIWTTMGNFAKYMILLARTNPDAARKYDGLSYFLAPMNVPGIETRPIRKITGEYGFTETFFTDARIPADCLMGEEGQGWKIAMQTLQYERGAEAGAAGGLMMVRVTIDDMIEELQDVSRDGEPVLQDPVMRDTLVKMIMEEKAVALGDRRAHIGALTSDYPGSLQLSHKLRSTEMTRRMRQFAINLQGAAGGLYVGDDEARQGGFWQRAYFNSFSATIGGGTSQVQANIVAEHILGLPK